MKNLFKAGNLFKFKVLKVKFKYKDMAYNKTSFNCNAP